MKKTIILTIIGVIIAGFIAMIGGLVISYFSYSNQEIRLRNAVVGAQESNKANFDKKVKVITQKAQITGQYANDFKEVVIQSLSATYKGKNPAMLWITQNVPNLDPSLYKELSQSVEALQNEFFMNQKSLISLQQEHKNLIMTAPGSIFLRNGFITMRDTIAITIVTSGSTKEAFATGEENDVKLDFGSKSVSAEVEKEENLKSPVQLNGGTVVPMGQAPNSTPKK